MRFNKQELMTLATQPSQKFDKEGTLCIRERQEGFFRRTEISLERWCRLRGNLLFYFKSKEQWSEPTGVIILEQCSFRVDQLTSQVQFGFSIVFDGGIYQQFGAPTSEERDSWLQALQLASYELMRNQLLSLRERIELSSGHKNDTDIQMIRLQRGIITDPSEIPICEISLSCDNLLCDGHGRPPNPVLEIDVQLTNSKTWIKYARTEVIESSSNPGFLITVSFRSSDGLNTNSKIRITAYDVRERVSQTATPMGSAKIIFSSIQDTPRLRIPLKSSKDTTVGFLTMNVWNLEADDKINSTESTPSHNIKLTTSTTSTSTSIATAATTATSTTTQIFSHRRSQSLPPRLGTKIKLPHQGQLKLFFANPHIQTYRFHSGLGGDICVHEIMAESKLCFKFPQQLLDIWIQEEKELLLEIAGMGELHEPWHKKQIELLDRHIQLLNLYANARENLTTLKGSYFKQSSRKNDRHFEFAPLNLHLQRMWVHNDTLNKCGFYDFITVGAFTAHSHKNKNGGLLRLVQALKESPMKYGQLYQGTSKITMANDAIQAIKQLRRDVVEAMRSLMKLAKAKQTSGMLPICDDMITKTRILLSLWDPELVEEALVFLEQHKVPKVQEISKNNSNNNDDDDGDDDGNKVDGNGAGDDNDDDDNNKKTLTLNFNTNKSLSPFKRITQQLNFDLKSPDFDDLMTPDTPECVQDMWAKESAKCSINKTMDNNNLLKNNDNENNFVIFPDVEDEPKHQNNCNDDNVNNNINNNSNNNDNEDDEKDDNYKIGCEVDISKRFLDTKKMCNSPSANYYKPTDEPEPWDLTQLNIEASVMCLVSKVKFLCGRCSSPAVRLRNKNSLLKTQSLRGCIIDKKISTTTATTTTVPVPVETAAIATTTAASIPTTSNVVTIQPKSTIKNDIKTKSLDNQNSNDNNNILKANDICQAVDTMTRVIKSNSIPRNKFTEGLDFASIVDWTNELRPSMKKLRQAMDGLLKTARLTHSVFRVQEDAKIAQKICNIRYRRDVCFSQALTSLVSCLMAKLWCQRPDPIFLLILTTLGPLVSFETLLSYYGEEIDMWGDMAVAIEDMHTVTFTLTRCGLTKNNINNKLHDPLPKVVGSRTALTVILPVPDGIYSLLPIAPSSRQTLSFNVTPVFFNIGINEYATLAESLRITKPQEKSNMDNFDRLNEYYLRYKKLNLSTETNVTRISGGRSHVNQSLGDLIIKLKSCVQEKISKNTDILQISSQICYKMKGLRLTSCKSGKDRTGMAITLEQVNILATEYHLSENEYTKALDCMRSEGCRRENTCKNIGVRKYAFNRLQILTFPKLYRPPTGTYGSSQT
ncbi:inositol polyphosphate-4-phosphatase type I A isoform X2 [Aphidius gifuensis]|uniref:inositol polyphosphate-4-phosphatase type I A isoform X2 n=1 Tax=Aphidius gifuensis TaxID=684658 RepID=UPI001CDC69ED|nr:inositol polyphosphate-4-phosphatase type I A isoform X2 [Aphidius gifuensis]XP_044014843.1 inositol polyphosphate-4-phosphatase type I A isoform X2 [Aphidius gifuensis]